MKGGKFYKGAFLIAFYDIDDNELMYLFDNVNEVLKFMKKPQTPENLQLVRTEIYRGLRRKDNFTRFLTGEILKIFLINIKE